MEARTGFAGLEADTATAAVGTAITCLGRLCEKVGHKSEKLQRLLFFLLVRVGALLDVGSDVIVAWELWKDGAIAPFIFSVSFLVLPVLLMTLGVVPGKILQSWKAAYT